MSQLLSGSYENWAIKYSMVICSGFKQTTRLMNHLRPLLYYVMLCNVVYIAVVLFRSGAKEFRYLTMKSTNLLNRLGCRDGLASTLHVLRSLL